MKRIITNHSFLFALGMIAGFLDMGTHHFLELAVWMIPFVVYGIISSDSLKSRAMVLSFSAGAMIAVVCSELIPQAFKDNKTVASYGVMMGFAVMMALDVALG